MRNSWVIWGRKGKRSPKVEVASPAENSSAATQLITVGGVGGGDHHAVAGPTVSLEVSGDPPDYPPRKFNKYSSIAEFYMASSPLTIVENNKPRTKSKPPINDVVSEEENSKKLAKRIVRKMKAANDEEEGNSKKAALTGKFGNSDIIYAESLEEAEMEAWPTRNNNPRLFRSILELYQVTQQIPS